MKYYLGILRFVVMVKTKEKEHQINSEMFQVVMAENKEMARQGLVAYFERTSNGAILLEARINDTIDQSGNEVV